MITTGIVQTSEIYRHLDSNFKKEFKAWLRKPGCMTEVSEVLGKTVSVQ